VAQDLSDNLGSTRGATWCFWRCGGLRTEDCTKSAGADRLTALSVRVRVRQQRAHRTRIYDRLEWGEKDLKQMLLCENMMRL
jgi:hypothetical protein